VRAPAFGVVSAALLLLSACQLSTKSCYIEILEREQIRHPLSQIQDVYKMVYQSAMGSAHQVTHGAAENYLRAEFSQLMGQGTGRLCDFLPPNGELIRVNLYPYVQIGASPQDLAVAFSRTAGTFEGSVERLERYWRYAEVAAEDGRLPFEVEDMRDYFAARAEEGYPAVHHSERYQSLYQPAYRVIAREHLPVDCDMYADSTIPQKR